MVKKRVIRCALCSLFFPGLFLGAPASAWPDSAGDTLPSATPPELDLTDMFVTFGPDVIELDLIFNPSTNPADLEWLSGFIDFDVDMNESTGRISHIEEFDPLPAPPTGVDYYVAFYPLSGMAELVFVDNDGDWSVGFYSSTINGTTVSVTIPQCEASSFDGICITARFKLAALVGNIDGPTDRAPNNDISFLGVPAPGDFDEDGDVDEDDFDQFQACATRAEVLYVPGTFPAGCTLEPDGQDIIPADFDEDGDVDQDDFGELQRNLTGAF